MPLSISLGSLSSIVFLSYHAPEPTLLFYCCQSFISTSNYSYPTVCLLISSTMSSIPQSSAPTPPTHLPHTLLYHCVTTSTSTTSTPQITAPPPPNLIHHSTPCRRPPKRRAAARALHTLSTAYVPALLASEINDPDSSSEPDAKAADTISNVRKPASPSSASSASEFAPNSTHGSLVSRHLAKRKRAGHHRTKDLPAPSSSDSSSMSDSAPGSRTNTMVHGRSTKGKRMVAEKGAEKVRSMKRKRRGEKLDRDDMKVIAGLSGGSHPVGGGTASVPKQAKKVTLAFGKVGE